MGFPICSTAAWDGNAHDNKPVPIKDPVLEKDKVVGAKSEADRWWLERKGSPH